MPTVISHFKGWRVVIYPNGHRPPHVHAIGVEEHVWFELLCALGQVRLLSNIGYGLGQLRQIEAYLLNHLVHLCSEWRRIHGHD